jgi:hypothetical protein
MTMIQASCSTLWALYPLSKEKNYGDSGNYGDSALNFKDALIPPHPQFVKEAREGEGAVYGLTPLPLSPLSLKK